VYNYRTYFILYLSLYSTQRAVSVEKKSERPILLWDIY